MKKNRFIRAAVFIAFVIAAALLIYCAFLKTMPELIPLLRSGDEAQIEEYLRASDHNAGLFCTALLQAVQVFSVVLPGAPIQIAAGIVYGIWRSFFICHLTAVAANVLVFLTARRMGTRMDQLVPVEKKSSKLDFLTKSDTPAYMTVIACLIPILPNGIIPYVAAKTKIKLVHFALAMYFGSLAPVLVLCAAGSKFLQGGYLMSAILVVALIIVVVLLVGFKDKILKGIKSCSGKLQKRTGKRPKTASFVDSDR